MAREQEPARLRKVDVGVLGAASLLLVTLVVGYLAVVPSVRSMFQEFNMTLPPATQLALSMKSLACVVSLVLVLLGSAALTLRRGRRAIGLALAGLSVLVTFAASTFLMYALHLPGMTSDFKPDLQQAEPDPIP